MRTVFLDSVGLVALWDESDQWHPSADRAYLQFHGSVRPVTTTFVLLECGNAAARKPYRPDVASLWQSLERDGNLIHPTPEQLDKAWGIYAKRAPGSAGVVDLVSFAVIRELGIYEAFTNDAHFRAEGFITLF